MKDRAPQLVVRTSLYFGGESLDYSPRSQPTAKFRKCHKRSWHRGCGGITMEQRADDSWSTLQGEVKMRTL